MPRLTDAQKDSLEFLYWHEKKTLPEIAVMYGVSYPAIRKWFIKLGISRRSNSEAQRLSNGTNEITQEILEQLYLKEEKSQNEIAGILNRSQTGIGLLLREYGIPARGKSNSGKHNGMFGRTHTSEAREKIRQANRRQFNSATARKNHAILTAKQIASGKTGKTHNRLETAFADILDTLHIQYTWQYRLGRYTYDFFVPQTQTLIEIHGTFWHADPRFYFRGNLTEIQQHNVINDKRKAQHARKSGYNILYFWEHDIHNAPHKVIACLSHL